MTAETSNARGEAMIAGALFDFLGYLTTRDERAQFGAVCDASPAVELLSAWAKNRCLSLDEARVKEWRDDLVAPPPAAAEPKTLPVPTHVYLTDKAAVIIGAPQRGWDEEGPDAHNCDDMGCATIGPHVLARVPFTDERALPQAAEARGVVDEGSRSVTRQLLHWNGVPVHVTGTVTTSPGNWSLIDAALATQHKEPTT